MNENKKRTSNAKRITALAMMTALSVVVGIVCKSPLFTYGVYYRFTLENIGVIMAGVFFGPLYGMSVGIASDIISCLLSTNPAVNPFITVGAASVGLISGVIFRALPQFSFGKRCVTAAVAAHLIGQVAIKSVAKMIMYGMPWFGIFIGLGFSAVAVLIETRVIIILSKNKQIMEFLA